MSDVTTSTSTTTATTTTDAAAVTTSAESAAARAHRVDAELRELLATPMQVTGGRGVEVEDVVDMLAELKLIAALRAR